MAGASDPWGKIIGERGREKEEAEEE